MFVYKTQGRIAVPTYGVTPFLSTSRLERSIDSLDHSSPEYFLWKKLICLYLIFSFLQVKSRKLRKIIRLLTSKIKKKEILKNVKVYYILEKTKLIFLRRNEQQIIIVREIIRSSLINFKLILIKQNIFFLEFWFFCLLKNCILQRIDQIQFN